MDMFDEWLYNQWENKSTKFKYSIQWGKMSALQEIPNLIPIYLVGYADDFCVITTQPPCTKVQGLVKRLEVGI